MPRLLALVVVVLAGLLPMRAGATATVAVERIQGSDRYETSAATAVKDCHSRVVLASGTSFADALSANARAWHVYGTVVLVPHDRLHPATARALDTCRSSEGSARAIAYIVGGPIAVSTGVEQEVAARGYEVVRVAGADRYDTAVQVTSYAADSGCECQPTEAIVASGEQWPDAASAGSILGFRYLLLTERDRLPEATRRRLESSVYNVIIAGGTAAISSEVEEEIRTICSVPVYSCIEVQRVAGATRQETAANLADNRQGGSEHPPTAVVLARGDAFPDAIASGRFAASQNGVLLLTGSPTRLHETTEKWLRDHRSTIEKIFVVGDESAVSAEVAEQARRAATSP